MGAGTAKPFSRHATKRRLTRGILDIIIMGGGVDVVVVVVGSIFQHTQRADYRDKRRPYVHIFLH